MVCVWLCVCVETWLLEMYVNTVAPHLLAVCGWCVRACWALRCPGCCWRWPGTHNPSRASVPSLEQTLHSPRCFLGLICRWIQEICIWTTVYDSSNSLRVSSKQFVKSWHISITSSQSPTCQLNKPVYSHLKNSNCLMFFTHTCPHLLPLWRQWWSPHDDVFANGTVVIVTSTPPELHRCLSDVLHQ